MNEKEFLDKYELPKLGWGSGKDFVEAYIRLIKSKESKIEIEIAKSRYLKKCNKELEEKLRVYENSIFNDLETIPDEFGSTIGLIDGEEDKFYLSGCDPIIDKYKEKIADLERENKENIVKYVEVNKLKNRALKRSIHSEKLYKKYINMMGFYLKVEDSYREIKVEIPYKIESPITDEYQYIGEIFFKNDKFWIQRSSNTDKFSGVFNVNDYDFKKTKNKKLEIDLNSTILIKDNEINGKFLKISLCSKYLKKI